MPALHELSTRAETQELQEYTLDQEQASQAFGAFNALKNHVSQYHEWKERLPSILNDIPAEPCELNGELRLLFDGERKDSPDNHLVGRLLQAHYTQNNQRYGINGVPRKIGAYLENSKGLFDRTQLYAMNRLQHCPPPVK